MKSKNKYYLMLILVGCSWQQLLFWLWPNTDIQHFFFLCFCFFLIAIFVLLSRKLKKFIVFITSICAFAPIMCFLQLLILTNQGGDPFTEVKQAVKFVLDNDSSYSSLTFEDIFIQNRVSFREDRIKRLAARYKFKDQIPSKWFSIWFEGNERNSFRLKHVKTINFWIEKSTLLNNDDLFYIWTKDSCYCFMDKEYFIVDPFCIDSNLNTVSFSNDSIDLTLSRADLENFVPFDKFFLKVLSFYK